MEGGGKQRLGPSPGRRPPSKDQPLGLQPGTWGQGSSRGGGLTGILHCRPRGPWVPTCSPGSQSSSPGLELVGATHRPPGPVLTGQGRGSVCACEEEPQTDRHQAPFLLNSAGFPAWEWGRVWGKGRAPSHTQVSAAPTPGSAWGLVSKCLRGGSGYWAHPFHSLGLF